MLVTKMKTTLLRIPRVWIVWTTQNWLEIKITGYFDQFVRVSTHVMSTPDWLLLATRIKHVICLFTYKSLALDRRWVLSPCLRLDLYTVQLQEDRCLSFLAEISAYLQNKHMELYKVVRASHLFKMRLRPNFHGFTQAIFQTSQANKFSKTTISIGFNLL